MKKLNIIILICLFSILFCNCSIKTSYINTNITENINQVTQKPSTTNEAYQVTTQETNNTINPNIATLENISKKSLGEYTLDDCFVIFHSSMNDIGKAYKLDVSRVSGGVIFLGDTLSTYVFNLIDGIFLLCPIQAPPNDIKIDINSSPHMLYFYGNDGESCVINGFQFGMNIDQVNQELLDNAKESFYKTSSPGPQIPAKQIEFSEKGMVITLTFEQYLYLEDGYYYLNNISVKLNED